MRNLPGRLLALDLLPEDPFWGGAIRFLTLVAIVTLSYLVGRLLRTLGPVLRRAPPTSSSLLLGRLVTVTLVLGGLWFGLDRVYELNPVGVVATLGVVSLALGFGLQNTVANIAAGVGLAMDKPFDVGDRIRVGQTWGDVVGIGLRSTRIRTTAGEHVVVPNSLMDTQEVWNYTHHEHRELRLEVPFQISYASSVRLAEHLALQAARACDDVLAYPDPAVRVREFAPDGVRMELRCWISRATDKALVLDALLRDVKRRFDDEGVHFPFPQRTVSNLRDLPEPAPTPEFVSEEHADKPIVLVATRGAGPGPAAVQRVVEFVERLDARMVVVHVRPRSMAPHARQPQEALNDFLQAARRRGVAARAAMEVGDVPGAIRRTCKEVQIRLVALAAPQQRFFGWHHRELRAIRDAAGAPVVFLDSQRPLDDRFVRRWHDRLHPQTETAEAPTESTAPSTGTPPSSASDDDGAG